MGEVWDIKRPPRSFKRRKPVSDERLITELFNRGVTIERIFGQFYALEEMASARSDEIFGNDEEGQHGRQPLTVGDALLAAPPLPPKVPLGTVPF